MLILASGISASAAFASIAEPSRRRTETRHRSQTEPTCPQVHLATSSSLKASGNIQEKSSGSLLKHKTAADEYFSKHGTLPLPRTMHAVISQPTNTDQSDENTENDNNPNQQRKNILVIGDVHGCLEEMLLLHQKAVEENDNQDFQYVILVGDLCNKGPQSAKVVKHVRSQDRWLAVRGNHDDGALAAAIGDMERRDKKKYHWVTDQSIPESTLTDEDILFLLDLPYTIRIPKSMLGDPIDTVVVHAGLVPNRALEDQTIETMITIREVQKNMSSGEYVYHKRSKEQECAEKSFEEPVAWASAWQGPFRVIFGHDARRGYQRYEGDWAIGLDTGVCYGKKLTGLVLPSRRIISVDSLKAHCPIANK